jgi:hypothetical protein
MKLSEIFTQLVHGEFSQLNLGGGQEKVIAPEDSAAVVAHVNLGLTALFTRFNLKEGRIVLRPIDGQLVYPLDDAFAVNNTKSKETVRYLIDTPEAPFRDDTLIKIEKVLDADECPLLLNVEDDPESCFTPALNVIRIPKEATNDLTLVYRENHRQIVVPIGYFDPSRVEIDLPYTHMAALLYFVASRAHNPVGMVNEFHKGNSYYAKYEAECAILESQNVKPDRMYENHRLIRNGWV